MEKVLVFGHKSPDTDSICSSLVTEKLARHYGLDAEAVRLGDLNKETEYILNYLGVEAPRKILEVEEGQKVVLVDHNEKEQSVDGREKAEVLGVIDHHRIAAFETVTPLYYMAKPYGCTSTVLYEIFKREDIEIDKQTAILMLSAIISDTLLLKSPTCTEKDREAYSNLEKIAGINAAEYGLEMLKAGTDLSMYSAEEIINLDAKEFSQNGKKAVISQVNTADINDVYARKDEIAFAMEKQISDRKLDIYMFLVTDIINTNSKAIVLGNAKDVVEKAFNKKLDENDSMFLEGVVSRKKQVVPPILENL